MAITGPNQERETKLETIVCNNLTWVNIQLPTSREVEYIKKRFSFHQLNLEDIVSRQSRPKINEYENYTFLVFQFPVLDSEADSITTAEIDIFVGPGYLITVDYAGNLRAIDDLFSSCQTNEEILQEVFAHDSGFLLYHIVSRLVDYCYPIIDHLGSHIENVENLIFEEKWRDVIHRISGLRREVIAFRRIVWPVRSIVTSIEPKVRKFTDTDVAAYFRSISDRMEEVWNALDEYKEVIEGLNATHDSLASNRINDILRVLTILSTIGTILTIIVSFYGMNVPMTGAWEGTGGSPLTVVYILISMLVVTVLMLYYFHRKHWL